METSSQDTQSQSLFKQSDPQNRRKELFICKICPSRMQERSIMRHFNDYHSKVKVKDIPKNIV
jgi:hypothetical protein